MRKGFILTMDVMLALIFAAVFVSMIMFFVTQPKPNTEEYLYSVSTDFLAVADKDGSIKAALNGDSSSINEFLYMMPDNLCLNLTVLDASDRVVFTNSTRCSVPTKYVIGKRTIVNNTNSYVSRLKVWYR